MTVVAVQAEVLPAVALIQREQLAVVAQSCLAVPVQQEQTSTVQFMVQAGRDIPALTEAQGVAELLILISNIYERQENEKFQL